MRSLHYERYWYYYQDNHWFHNLLPPVTLIGLAREFARLEPINPAPPVIKNFNFNDFSLGFNIYIVLWG